MSKHTMRGLRRHRAHAGFTLIEALVALLVTALGMLAIAGMQITISGSSDVAKQRSEAVRLAQLKIEQLRSFEQITADGTKFDYATDVVSGNDTVSPGGGYTTNTTYTRTWTLTKDGVNAPAADGSDPQKWIQVNVAWTDRAGQAQNVRLDSVISRADPVKLGTLYTGPGGTQVRRPKNRDINIPYPAISLPGQMSAFKPPPSTNNYIFDNVTGDILGFCNDSAVTNSLTTNTALSLSGTVTAGCTSQPAYVLSGYIRFLTNLPSGNEFNKDSAITNTTDTTRALTASIVFNTSITGTGTQAADCFTQRQKVVSVGNITIRDIASISRSGNVVTVTTTANHGFGAGQVVAINNVPDASFNNSFTLSSASGNSFTFAQVGANASPTLGLSGAPTPTAALVQQVTIDESATPPTGYNSVTSRFVAYTCIVRGMDDDISPQPIPNTRARWWGQFVITTDGTWTLGTGSGNWKVCRFTGDYVPDDLVSNTEHPLVYRGVSGPLDSQNYLVIRGNDSCPDDTETDPLNGVGGSVDYTNTNTVTHQTQAVSSGTAPYGGSRSTTSSQWPTSGQEPVTTSTTPLPMF